MSLAYPVQITLAVALRVTVPLVAVRRHDTMEPAAFAPLQSPAGDADTA